MILTITNTIKYMCIKEIGPSAQIVFATYSKFNSQHNSGGDLCDRKEYLCFDNE